jgi:hypothetical protein
MMGCGIKSFEPYIPFIRNFVNVEGGSQPRCRLIPNGLRTLVVFLAMASLLPEMKRTAGSCTKMKLAAEVSSYHLVWYSGAPVNPVLKRLFVIAFVYTSREADAAAYT